MTTTANRPSRSFRRGVSLAMRAPARVQVSHVRDDGEEFAREVRGFEPRFKAQIESLDPDASTGFCRATVRKMDASLRALNRTSSAKRAIVARDYAQKIRTGTMPAYVRSHVRTVFLPNARHAIAMGDATMADSLRAALAKAQSGQW